MDNESQRASLQCWFTCQIVKVQASCQSGSIPAQSKNRWFEIAGYLVRTDTQQCSLIWSFFLNIPFSISNICSKYSSALNNCHLLNNSDCQSPILPPILLSFPISYPGSFFALTSLLSSTWHHPLPLPLLCLICSLASPPTLSTLDQLDKGGSLQLRSPLLPSSPPSSPYSQKPSHKTKERVKHSKLKINKIYQWEYVIKIPWLTPKPPNLWQHYAPTERGLVDLFAVVLGV